MSEFDLTRILTGSEGTLAFITEARLDITRLPKVRRLVNVKYDSFDSALRNAPFMVEAKALSVETVDSKVLNLAREDIVWHSVSELITDVPDKEMLGLNIVEFAGDDAALIDQQVTTLCQRLDELMAAARRASSAGRSVTILMAWSASMPCARRPSACWVMPKAPPSRFLSPRIPAYRPNIWRIISSSSARCSTATA
jgi:FAD/FMN-containing dehydrogenase